MGSAAGSLRLSCAKEPGSRSPAARRRSSRRPWRRSTATSPPSSPTPPTSIGSPRFADEVEAALGPIEILVANTGGPPFGGALDHEVEEWERAYRSLVLAPVTLARAVVPGMRERGWGRIVNVGSTSTREPIPGLNLSNAHRMAAIGFLKTLSLEVAGDGITVNTVLTGRFATERLAGEDGSLEGAEEAARTQVPAAGSGHPEEYGDLVAFLCSERAAYITGTTIPIDGGVLRSSF